MKNLAIIFFLGISSLTNAQNFWTSLNGPYGGTINDIVSPSSGVMLASTANGVYRTTNSGDTWTRMTLGTDNSFTDLEIDPSSAGAKIYAATPSGARIYISTDAGVTWSQLTTTGITSAVAKIEVASTGTTIYLIDNSLRLLKSTNSGTSFSTSFTFAGTTITDLDLDPSNNVYVSTASLGIKVSTTGGASFTTPAAGSLLGAAAVYSTVINGAGAIFCLSSNGAHKSTNVGVSYATINTNLVDASYSGTIDLDAAGNIYLFNNDFKKIYTSTAASGGASWTNFSNPFWQLPVTASYFESADLFFLGLGNIGIAKAVTNGSVWASKSSGIKAFQNSGSKIFEAANTLFWSGTDIGHYYSSSGGTAWTLDATGVTNRNIVGFVELSDASVLAYGNGIIRLPNQFSAWALQSSQVLSQLVTSNGVNLFSFNGTNLLTSINQGVTWTSQALTGLPGVPNKIQVDAGNNLYFSFSNEIYKVNSGGTTAAKLTALTATSVQDFQVVANSVYVIGNSNTFYVSADNGATFLSKNAPTSSSLVWVSDSKYMSLKTTTNSFYVSNDGGGIWTSQALNDTQATPTDAMVSDVGYLYVATTNSTLHRSTKHFVPPVAPTNLITIGKSFDRIELVWKDNSNNETSYTIESSVGDNLNYAPVSLGFTIGGYSGLYNDLLNVAVTGLEENTLYFFRVRAVNGAGSSAYSNEINVNTLDKCTSTIPNNRSWTAVATADPGSTASGPGPFTNSTVNIVAVANSPNTFTFTDHDMGISPVGAFGQGSFMESCGSVYNIEYNTVNNGNGTWNGTNTIVLKWEDSYAYYSGFEGTTTFTLNLSDPAPATPTLNAYLYSGTEILLNWNAIPYATQYDIERATGSGGPYSAVTTVNYPAVIYLDKNLTTGQTYYYRIRSKNTVSSAPSAEAGIALQNGLFRPVENDIQKNFENQQGISWGDLDGDGDEDIASPSFTNNAGQNVPPVFFENMGNGKDFTRRDLSVLTVENTAVSRGINLFDFNNDGLLDMYITRSLSPGTIEDLLLINEGAWNFTKQNVTQTGDVESTFRSSAAADYDQDGFVDVFVGHGNAQTLHDLMLRNSMGTSLIDVGVGALTTDLGDSRNISWIDFDNDNDQDMFVLNSSGSQPNRLYQNNGDGTFTRLTGLVFDTDIMANPRTVSWGDIDNDGDFDLFVASQSTSVAASAVDRLYRNNGNGTFTSIGGTAAESATPTFGSSFGDIDNDGDLDLIAINSTANSIFLNNGSGTFTKYAVQEMANHPGINEIGGALCDFDKDGFLDFYPSKGQTTATDLPNFLYRNLTAPSASRNWIEIKLVGTLSNKAAIGARVTVTTTSPARTQIREVSTRTGYGSANSLIVHVGIGSAPSAGTTIQIKWPSGFIQTINNPAINQVLTITEDVHADFTFTPPPTFDSKFVTSTLSTGATVNFKTLAGVKLFYRKIGAGDFNETDGVFNAGTSKYDFTVEKADVDANGLEYYLTAQIGTSTVSRLPATEGTNFYTYINYLEVDNPIPSEHIGLGGTKNSWKIFSIPFDLGSNNNITTVFDELAELTDQVDWRMIAYKNATAWGQFPGDFSTITRGKGYFINIKNAVDIKAPEAAASNNRKNLFQMQLKTGWNQIGNPYLTQISWDDVVAYNGLTGTTAQLKTFSGSSYSNDTGLDPFEGGFVLAESNMTISIPFLGQTEADGRQHRSVWAEGDWILPIALKQGEVENNFGGIGMRASAQNSFDENDDINAPRFMDFIEMNFDHPEHIAQQFARDVVPVQNEYLWSFSVESSSEEVAELRWNQLDAGTEKDLLLFDEGLQRVIKMKENSVYNFKPAESKNFKIYVGENAEEKLLPTRVLLSKAYPNPSSDRVNFEYTLAEGKSYYGVKFEVFDLMGRKVATLVNGNYAPGFYSTTLKTDDNAILSGMYTCRLTVIYDGGQKIQSQKIIIKK